MGSQSAIAPPVGGYRRVGDARLFVDQRGAGTPTVVFLPGAGLTGLDYFRIHERVAASWSSVIYDRGGTGWSERVRLPRTAQAVTDELHELLCSIEAGPVLLVGHSLGGLYARHYATQFPEAVDGLVLLDPAHENYDMYMPAELSAARAGNRSFAVLNAVVDVALRTPPTKALLGALPPTRRYQRLYRELFTNEMVDWEPQLREALVARHVSLDWLVVGLRESRNIDDLYHELRESGPVPDVPITVLSSTGTDGFREAVSNGQSQQLQQAEADGKLRLYRDMAGSVRYGRVIPVDGGHVTLPFRHSDCIVYAIGEMSA